MVHSGSKATGRGRRSGRGHGRSWEPSLRRSPTSTERDLLPLLSLGPDAFYDPLTGELEPRFQVHMDQLRTLRDEITYVVERADTLHRRVLTELEEIR
jgi:hypothetical protein